MLFRSCFLHLEFPAREDFRPVFRFCLVLLLGRVVCLIYCLRGQVGCKDRLSDYNNKTEKMNLGRICDNRFFNMDSCQVLIKMIKFKDEMHKVIAGLR